MTANSDEQFDFSMKKSYLLFIKKIIFFQLQKKPNIFKKVQRVKVSLNKLCISGDLNLVLAITS